MQGIRGVSPNLCRRGPASVDDGAAREDAYGQADGRAEAGSTSATRPSAWNVSVIVRLLTGLSGRSVRARRTEDMSAAAPRRGRRH